MYLEHLENKSPICLGHDKCRIREVFLTEGPFIEPLNRWNLDIGKEASRVEETKKEDVESGGQVGPILLG